MLRNTYKTLAENPEWKRPQGTVRPKYDGDSEEHRKATIIF
jgi:hypothetical protein